MEAPIDLVVLGGGAGIFAATRSAQLGLKVVLVEKGRIGGACLHWGGLATKTLTSTVELYKDVEKRSKKGIHGSISLDWKEMKESKDGICSLFSKFCGIALNRSGVRIVHGTGEILTPTKVKILSTNGEEEVVDTRNILIAVGSVPSTIPGVELGGSILDSDKALELEAPPESLLIVGGGVIGLEFATIFSALGSKVIVIEILPKLLPSEEPEVGAFLERNLKKENVEVLLDSRVTEVKPAEDGVEVKILTPVEEITRNADKVLVAVGRRPNIDLESLEAIGVRTTRRGIIVNDRMQTSVENIWAAGDVVDPHLLANVAMMEAKVAATNIAGKNKTMDYDVIPRCVFTIPEVASIGLTEKQAQEQGLETRAVKANFAAQNFRAAATNKTEGFIKIVTLSDGTIIGATIVGAQASDLISEFLLAIKKRMTAEEMSELVYAHPSYSEAIQNALEKIQGRALI